MLRETLWSASFAQFLLMFSWLIIRSSAVESNETELQMSWMKNTSIILQNLKQDYDVSVAPYMAGKPVIVNLRFEVLTFGEIDEANMEFGLDMYFYQYWKDVRLVKGQDRTVTLTGKGIYSIWIPDTYFVNAKSLNIHNVVMENQMAKIHPNGTVQYMARISLTAHCRMELSMYPLDRQNCDLVMESFSLTKEALVYKWKGFEENICTVSVFDASMAQFVYRGVSLLEHHDILTSPGFSDVYARFVFDRRVRYTILQTYLPSYMITIASFVGFWIPRDAVPARVALGITTMLTIVYFLGAVDSRMPHVSYMKAIDYHIFVSFGFVFICLLEYVIVLNLPMSVPAWFHNGKDKSYKNRNCEEDRPPFELNEGPEIGTSKQDPELRHRTRKSFRSNDVNSSSGVTSQCSCSAVERNKHMHGVHPLDKVSRILFPLVYVILVGVYWGIYSLMNEQSLEPNRGHALCKGPGD